MRLALPRYAQVKYLLGYSVPRADAVHEQLHHLVANSSGFKWQEWVMGTLLLSLLLTMKFVGKRVRRLRWLRTLGPLTASTIGILVAYIGSVGERGIKIVGRIPSVSVMVNMLLQSVSQVLPRQHGSLNPRWALTVCIYLEHIELHAFR